MSAIWAQVFQRCRGPVTWDQDLYGGFLGNEDFAGA